MQFQYILIFLQYQAGFCLLLFLNATLEEPSLKDDVGFEAVRQTQRVMEDN